MNTILKQNIDNVLGSFVKCIDELCKNNLTHIKFPYCPAEVRTAKDGTHSLGFPEFCLFDFSIYNKLGDYGKSNEIVPGEMWFRISHSPDFKITDCNGNNGILLNFSEEQYFQLSTVTENLPSYEVLKSLPDIQKYIFDTYPGIYCALNIDTLSKRLLEVE